MLAGIFNFIGKAAAATRGLSKVSLGLNPNQPFELRAWLHQFFQGGGGMSEARSAGASSGASQSIMDNINRSAQQSRRN